MPKGDREILKADPQDGTTPIANLLLEALAIASLTSKERAAVLFLIRRTYGWQINGQRLKADIIPLTTWTKVLQVKEPARASKILSDLTEKGVVKRWSLGPGKSYAYQINTTLNTWNNCLNLQLLSEMSTLVLSKMTRVLLSEMTTPDVAKLALPKEILNKNKRRNSYRDIENKKRCSDDTDKYIKGRLGHMVNR